MQMLSDTVFAVLRLFSVQAYKSAPCIKTCPPARPARSGGHVLMLVKILIWRQGFALENPQGGYSPLTPFSLIFLFLFHPVKIRQALITRTYSNSA